MTANEIPKIMAKVIASTVKASVTPAACITRVSKMYLLKDFQSYALRCAASATKAAEVATKNSAIAHRNGWRNGTALIGLWLVDSTVHAKCGDCASLDAPLLED